MGIFEDDSEPSFEGWLAERLEGLAPGIRSEAERWTRVLRDDGPRSLPRREGTVWLYLNRVRPALLEWSNRYDHLREVTRDDVLTYVKTLHGRQRHDQLVALRSLFSWAKRNGLIFRNPTSRIKVGQYEYAVLQPLVPDQVDRSVAVATTPGALLAVSLLVDVVRRIPLLALAMALFGSTAVVVGTPSSVHESLAVSYQGQFLSYLAVDLVLGFIVATCAWRASIVAVAVSVALQLLVIGVFAHGDGLAVNEVIALLALAASCMAGLLSRERREHAVALRTQEVAEAVTAERLEIAREPHDMVAHSIGIIAIQAGVGSRVIQTQPAEAREALRAIEVTSRETLSGLRRTLVSLRQADRGATASNQSPLAPSPGLADVEQLTAATAGAGYASTCAAVGSRVLCQPTSTCPPTASCRRR
ncbi:hypothetical protein SSPO_005640 [Streptomyces antimycoticus]|uniref:Signal transduction histidine kinase subgroup 3 dimerisation and phosphoacceptor domain-containing protein n=1 Tax=Streptomyces antimycoticus TaxID=68175 RepID=A0A499UM95_9ACTN|nr:histidine kinase [Streptomyces antimycoticus]BBJ37846.1 hypothetical protein SSPO_005640 [Streptomyces antimycoticus]